jgi:hypothetical protein
MKDQTLIDWLSDSDPALRWQVERDLLGASEAVWAETRARVAAEGIGARLLALQDPDGQWAGGRRGSGLAVDGHDLVAELAPRIGGSAHP